MLKIIRKKGFIKKMMWFLAVVIILSFGFLGSAYLLIGLKDTRSAGKIFGKTVSIEAFSKAYNQAALFAKLRYADKFYEIQSELDLDSQAWDRLILLQEAKRRRINIPNEEVVKAIAQYPIFQRDNQFDNILYTAILRSSFLRTEPQEFEESIRDNLKVAELISQEIKSYQPSQEDLLQTYKELNEKVQISYTLIHPEQFTSAIQVSDEEASQYYASNKFEFLIPLSIKIDYALLSFPETSDNGKEQPSETDESAKDAVRAQAVEIYQEFQTTPSLTTLAQKYNIQIQSTPYLNQQQEMTNAPIPFALLSKMFSAKENVLAEPLETEQGIFLALVGARRDSYIPEFNEVQGKVKEAVMNMKAKGIATANAQEYQKSIKSAYESASLKDFAKIVKDMGLELEQTPAFNRGVYLPKIGTSPEFQEAAFALSESNPISEPVETIAGVAILHLDNYSKADENAFDKDKDRLIRMMVDQKTGEVYGELIAQLRLKANLQDNISKLKAQQ